MPRRRRRREKRQHPKGLNGGKRPRGWHRKRSEGELWLHSVARLPLSGQ